MGNEELLTINGWMVQIIPDQYLPCIGTVQARKHKKHRINKKWLKRYGFKPVYDQNFAVVLKEPMMRILVSKKVYGLLREEVERGRAKWLFKHSHPYIPVTAFEIFRKSDGQPIELW